MGVSAGSQHRVGIQRCLHVFLINLVKKTNVIVIFKWLTGGWRCCEYEFYVTFPSAFSARSTTGLLLTLSDVIKLPLASYVWAVRLFDWLKLCKVRCFRWTGMQHQWCGPAGCGWSGSGQRHVVTSLPRTSFTLTSNFLMKVLFVSKETHS